MAILTVAVLYSLVAQAQNIEPQYEPDYDLEFITLVQLTEKEFYALMVIEEAWNQGLSDEMTDLMVKTVKCESGFNPKAYNGSDSHRNSIGSRGIAQFATETINHYGKQAGILNPDPYNARHALKTMAYMFDIGQARQWTCYRKLVAQS